MHTRIQPHDWAVLKLPSGMLKLVQIEPNSIISIPKIGSFHSNLLLGRPYYVTYEFLDKADGQTHHELRPVPASELHADIIAEENAVANQNPNEDGTIIGEDGTEFALVGENGEVVMRTNRQIIDDAARQTLSMEEIETLKRDGVNAGKDLIAKLMLSHTGINQKTSFSLAKYKLLKTKKFLRQFQVLPVDVPTLVEWLLEEKDTSKTLDLRDEALALAGCWANVHRCSNDQALAGVEQEPRGRWLVIDETGGLVVAAMAERMGLLHRPEPVDGEKPAGEGTGLNARKITADDPDIDLQVPFQRQNTITMVHTNAQPNLSLLKFFNFNPDATPSDPPHPLTTNLHTLSWLQLLHPGEDTTYATPPPSASYEEVMEYTRARRSNYFRKRRRWAKTRTVIEDTRRGGFDGLVIASSMDMVGVLRVCLPLLRGGAHISIYNASVEPLAQIVDLYSISRRTAFIQGPPQDFYEEYMEKDEDELSPKEKDGQEESKSKLPSTIEAVVEAAGDKTESEEMIQNGTEQEEVKNIKAEGDAAQPEEKVTEPESSQSNVKDPATWPGNEDFPLNPTLLLNVVIHTSRARRWQVLPGRTHPLMTSRGGAEGYVLTAIRVLPAKGKVTARGKSYGRAKRRKLDTPTDAGTGTGTGTGTDEA